MRHAAEVSATRLEARPRSSVRRTLLVTLAAGFTLAGWLAPTAEPPSARAAQPDPARCQVGFLSAAKPTQTDCAPADDPELEPLAVPAGFQETVVWSGLTNPTAIRFAADGRVFVAEKSGVVKIFDNLTDTTPTVFSGLTTNVHNFWDRGLLGLALDPSLTGGSGSGSFVYVLYAYDHILGDPPGSVPRWGDQCLGQPNGPGATTDGCVISARLSRFAVSGNTITPGEQVLIEDWCQQYPSHSIGSLQFGPDGALYVSGGDGASFNGVDYGQLGGTTSPVFTEKNPCGDPPKDGMSPPTAEGGSLRSQDMRTAGSGGGSTYSQTVLADTPIAYWRLGESSGTTLIDATGNHSGTYVGSPTLGSPGAIAGDSNTAVTFNGAANKYGVATGWTTIPAPPATLEAWIRWDGVTWPTNTSVLGWFHQSGVRAFRFWVSGNGTNNINLRIGTEQGNANWDWVGEDTDWHHLVGTIDGSSNARLYFDGALVSGPTAVTFSGGTSDHPLWIGTGSDTGNTDASWPGGIDEAAIYNYAFSAAQVQAHFNAGTSGQLGTDPASLDGAILRVDPVTGAGVSGNPFFSSADPNARRIIATGLRNPFRITFRPGTNELWVGDVGWTLWEEINRIPNATDAVAENFGWPCYEGSPRQSGYDGANLSLCENLYAEGAGAVATPFYAYHHSNKVVATDNCPTGSSSITGLAFYPEAGGSYPSTFRGGVFFADHSRNCIWFIPKGSNGQPDPAQVQVFVDGAAHPVELVIGPGSDLFYVDFNGSIRRISATGGNQPPTAVIQATPTSGTAPLTVQFNGSGSSDPEGTPLTYEWDLDGDGAYDDATGVTASRTYTSPGNVTTGLRVTDVGSATGTDTQVISVSNSPPVPVISTPAAGTTWKVGDLITFSGSATDPQDGNLPASALSWSLTMEHCPSTCHSHPLQTFTGVASGQFSAPDHEYPSHLELTLTATDSFGTQSSVTRELHPQTVGLTFQSVPTGLSLAVNASSSTTQFTRTVIVGSSNSVTATSPQTLGGATYTFVSWSDSGAQSHQVVAPATNTTYTATYQTTSTITFLPTADARIRSSQPNTNYGTSSTLRVRVNQTRSYLKFVVTGLTGPPTSATLRLRVTNGGSSGASCYKLTDTSWTETGITWNNAPPITGSPLSVAGSASSGTWLEFNLGSAITGNGTYTFAISNGGTNEIEFASRETSNDPQLVLTR